MATSDPRRRRRLFWWWFGGASFLIIAALLFVRFFLFNDNSTPLTTDEALARYRSSTSVVRTTVPAPETQTLPATGVYRYETVGRESIDALDGAEHIYPDETTITYTPAGCGVHMRWAPLVERNDEWNLCVTEAGIELQREGGAYHMFFGTAEVEPLTCDRTVVLVPADRAEVPGEPVQLSCIIGKKDWAPVWQVLERDTRTVDGVEIEVQHVRMTVVDTDDYPETITLDWYLNEHGLLIEASLAKETLAESVLGPVTYLESYTLKLISLTPLQ